MLDLPPGEQAHEAAVRLAEASAPAGARVLLPIPVHAPAGDVESWFVPIAVGDRLVGYVRVGPAGASYSAFGREQSLAAWTDPGEVRALADTAGRRTGGRPFLGYDGAPSRLAWVVPLAGGGVAFVAGEAVWASSPPSPPSAETT